MMDITTEYIAAGGNRQSQCADWSTNHGIVAFGAATNVALWMPTVASPSQISRLRPLMV